MYGSQKSRIHIKHFTADGTFPTEPSHSTAAAVRAIYCVCLRDPGQTYT